MNKAVGVVKNKSILGYVEGIDKNFVVHGWAHAVGSNSLPEIQLVIDNAIVYSGKPTRIRPDLVRTVAGNCPTGFNIDLPRNSIRKLNSIVHVLANGHLLAGSPLELDLATNITIDAIGRSGSDLHFKISGWPRTTMKGTIRIDGFHAADVDIEPADDVAKGAEFDFDWPIPSGFRDGRLHVYSLEVDHGSTVVRSDLQIFRDPDYELFIDQADRSRICGWILQSNSANPVLIQAKNGNMVIGSTFNDIIREDVAIATGNKWRRLGFDLQFERPLTSGCQTVLLQDAANGVEVATIDIFNRYQAVREIATTLAAQKTVTKDLSDTLLEGSFRACSGGVEFRWNQNHFRNDAAKQCEICVVIPVYGGAIEVAECIESVLASKNDIRHRIIVVNDNAPDPVINSYLRSLETRGVENLSVIWRTENGGFSAAVNMGMIAAQSSDVILLNADTVVSDYWLDRIAAVAASDKNIGTITPFSNNGEICSLPYSCKSRHAGSPIIAAQINAVASSENAGKIYDIPVAVGFCMFIRRECLNEIGPFDAVKWGRGYGEEVDFCIKASKRGWRHVLAPDIFVVHRGAVSFGDEKLNRIIESARKISVEHPFYDDLIQDFICADSIAPARRAINIELLHRHLARKRVLHVCHDLGGGTQKYVDDLKVLYSEGGFKNVELLSNLKSGFRLKFDTGSLSADGLFDELHSERYSQGENEQLKADILKLGFSHIHIHSPLGLLPDMLQWLTSVHDYYVTIHDYAWICPRITLTTSAGTFYDEPSRYSEGSKDAMAFPYPGMQCYVDAASGDIIEYKQKFAEILGAAQVVFAPSRDVANRLISHGVQANFKVIPHPVLSGKRRTKPQSPDIGLRPGERIRVALFGGISDIKGFQEFLACAECAARRSLAIDFILFGYTRDNRKFEHLQNVLILGPYDENKLEELVTAYKPHLSFFPNQWPETFSYTLSHAMQYGLWPIVTDIGAPAERVNDVGFGTVIPALFEPDFFCNIIGELANQKATCISGSYNQFEPVGYDEYFGVIM